MPMQDLRDRVGAGRVRRAHPRLEVIGALVEVCLFVALVVFVMRLFPQDYLAPPPTLTTYRMEAGAALLVALLLPLATHPSLRTGLAVEPRGLVEYFALGFRRVLPWRDIVAVDLHRASATIRGDRHVVGLAPPQEDWLAIASTARDLAAGEHPAVAGSSPAPGRVAEVRGPTSPLSWQRPLGQRLFSDALVWAVVTVFAVCCPATDATVMFAMALLFYGSRWQRPAVGLCGALAAAEVAGGPPFGQLAEWSFVVAGLVSLMMAARLLVEFRPGVVDETVATEDQLIAVRGCYRRRERLAVGWSGIWSVTDYAQRILVVTTAGDAWLPRHAAGVTAILPFVRAAAAQPAADERR